MEVPTKQQLLEHYNNHEPRQFIRVDAFDAGNVPDVEFEGKPPIYMEGGRTHELICGDFDVRVLIKPGMTKEVALRLLKHVQTAIELNGLPDEDVEGQALIELIDAADEALKVLASFNEGDGDVNDSAVAAYRLDNALQRWFETTESITEHTERVC